MAQTSKAIGVHEVGISICEMLGLDPEQVTSISFSVDAASIEPLSIEVVMCPDENFNIEGALRHIKFIAVEDKG